MRSLDGVAGRLLLDHRAPLGAFHTQRQDDGGVRLSRRPGLPAKTAADAAAASGPRRRRAGAGDEQARLALVAVRHHARHRGHDGRARCINPVHRLLGCTQGAKASNFAIAHQPEGEPGRLCELRPRRRVWRSPTGDTCMAAGVVYIDAEGVRQFQAAEVAVAACDQVSTPRSLLQFSIHGFDGLANSSGLVGKNLMLYPCASVHFCHLLAYLMGDCGSAMCIRKGISRDLSGARLLAPAIPLVNVAVYGRYSPGSGWRRWTLVWRGGEPGTTQPIAALMG